MTEQSTIDFVNKVSRTNLVLCKDEFSSYDAYDDNYIVEIKNRRKYYKEKLIECSKLFVNYQKSILENKRFLYVVTDENGVWVYSITKHIDTIINQKPLKLPCPSKTDFKNGVVINKFCYTLSEKLSIKL